MKSITRFIDIVLYTFIFGACCATGLCMATERLINNCNPGFVSPLHILVLGSSLFVYNLPVIINSSHRNRFFTFRGIFCAIGIVLTLISFFKLSPPVILYSVILGAFSLAYSLPLLPLKSKRRLRDFGWLKIIDLAGVWTIATSVLPIIYWQKNLGDYPFEVLIRFVLIFALCILFDLRDMQIDFKNNIETLPHKIGVKNCYRLIDLAIFFFLLLSAFQYIRFHSLGRLAGAIITTIVLKLVMLFLKKHPSDRAYFGLLDGVMLFYAVMVLL